MYLLQSMCATFDPARSVRAWPGRVEERRLPWLQQGRFYVPQRSCWTTVDLRIHNEVGVILNMHGLLSLSYNLCLHHSCTHYTTWKCLQLYSLTLWKWLENVSTMVVYMWLCLHHTWIRNVYRGVPALLPHGGVVHTHKNSRVVHTHKNIYQSQSLVVSIHPATELGSNYSCYITASQSCCAALACDSRL